MAKVAAKAKEQVEVDKASAVVSRGGLVTIPGIKSKTAKTLIVGTAVLVVNKFSQKVQEKILAKHMGAAAQPREAKDPHLNFMGARHRLADETDGFPAGGIKAAIVSATGIKDTGVATTKAKGAIRVHPDDHAGNLVRIITPHEPEMREDITRNETGTIDIRHRPAYWPWAMLLNIEYLAEYISLMQLLQAIEQAGFRIGLGEWRPGSKESKSGSWGTWRLAHDRELELFQHDRKEFWRLLAGELQQAAE